MVLMDTLTRRNLLRLGIFLTPAFLSNAAGHFWDSKPASQWTAEEIAELASKSPWAKLTMAQYRQSMDDLAPRPDSDSQQGRGEARAGACGLVTCGQIMPGEVTVIWESAQPIREAIHPVIPPQFNGRYVISIRGLEGTQTLDKLEAGAELTVKGKASSPVRRRRPSAITAFSSASAKN